MEGIDEVLTGNWGENIEWFVWEMDEGEDQLCEKKLVRIFVFFG